MKIFDQRHSEIFLGELAKPKKSEPLHELEGSMKPTPFQNIIEGVEYLQNALPREKAPLQQELSSQEEGMRIPPSRRDQAKGSLNDEVFSNDEEKEVKELERASNVVIARGDIPLFGDGDEAIASTRGALVSLQEVPKDLTYED